MNARCLRRNLSGKAKATICESWRPIEENSMKNKYRGLTIVFGFAMVLILGQLQFSQAPAQGGGGRGRAPGGGGRGGAPAAPAGPVVRTADGKPDFTGYWMAATKTNINSGAPNMGIINPETGQPGGKIP